MLQSNSLALACLGHRKFSMRRGPRFRTAHRDLLLFRYTVGSMLYMPGKGERKTTIFDEVFLALAHFPPAQVQYYYHKIKNIYDGDPDAFIGQE